MEIVNNVKSFLHLVVVGRFVGNRTYTPYNPQHVEYRQYSVELTQCVVSPIFTQNNPTRVVCTDIDETRYLKQQQMKTSHCEDTVVFQPTNHISLCVLLCVCHASSLMTSSC